MTMAQQVDMPPKEVPRFNKSRCFEVTRIMQHYHGEIIIPKDVISLECSKTGIDAGVLMARRKIGYSI
jgi:hypothetical protein